MEFWNIGYCLEWGQSKEYMNSCQAWCKFTEKFQKFYWQKHEFDQNILDYIKRIKDYLLSTLEIWTDSGFK